MAPLVRIVEASLGAEAQVRLVVSGVSAPDRLRSAWASSGAAVERDGERLAATTILVALTRAAGRCLPSEEAADLEKGVHDTMAAWQDPATDLEVLGGQVSACEHPLTMGVINVTPDSFSDGGALFPSDHPQAGIAHGRRLCDEGADMIDIGGESSRPGSQSVDVAEELRRVVPVIEALAADGILVSVDTVKPEVARPAIDAGARIVNDVSGGRNLELLELVAASGAGYVLMHTRGTPADMGSRTAYDDVVAEVYEFLAEGAQRCQQAGIPAARIAVDPGLGFAKESRHNLALLRATRQLCGLGHPVLIGASRKRFLGDLLAGAAASERLEGSLACAAAATAAGAAIIRVHDVAPTARLTRVTRAITTAGPS